MSTAPPVVPPPATAPFGPQAASPTSGTSDKNMQLPKTKKTRPNSSTGGRPRTAPKHKTKNKNISESPFLQSTHDRTIIKTLKKMTSEFCT